MTQTLAIIDYGSGNLRSAAKAFDHVATAENLPVRVIVTDKAADVAGADRIVLPGQGAFGDCMNGLSAVPGMIDALHDAVIEKGRPFFGICVGMQLLATRGLEFRVTPGLDWISGEVKKLEPSDPALTIPHMGWNAVERVREHPLFAGVPVDAPMYYANSFALNAADPADVIAYSDHGGRFTAAVARGNVAGAQFHPEKSQDSGLSFLANFLEWRP